MSFVGDSFMLIPVYGYYEHTGIQMKKADLAESSVLSLLNDNSVFPLQFHGFYCQRHSLNTAVNVFICLEAVHRYG